VIVKEVVSEEQTKKIAQLTEEFDALKVLLDKKKEQIQQLEDDIKTKEEVIEELSKSEDESKKLQMTIVNKNEEMEKIHKELEYANERLHIQTQQINTQQMLEKSLTSHNRDVSSVFGEQLKDKTQVIVTALQQMQTQQNQMLTLFQKFFQSITKCSDHPKRKS